MQVPLLDLQAQYATIRDEVTRALARVCDSQQFILGPEVESLERELASMLDVREAIAVSSGTDALLVALMALGIGPGDEVVTSTYSFFASAGCIARVGARPVFVDIDPATCNLDPRAVRAAVGPRTRAVIPVHLYGLSADLDPILETARTSHLAVIEDAAQAIGARYRGRAVGGWGTLGCFSFFPTKNLGAFGDGGLVTTNDPELARGVRRLRTHGAEPKYVHKAVGGNFRLDAIQAAVLRVKARHLQTWTDARRVNAGRYATLFDEAGLIPRVGLPVEPDGCLHVYNQYVVRVPDRDALRAHLQARGVGTEVYYPIPLHVQECFSALGYGVGSLPEAERAARETLAIPVYPELREDQQRVVVEAIAGFYAGRRAVARQDGT